MKFLDNLKKASANRERKKAQQEIAIIKKRNKFLPGIQKLAHKYHAKVEALDTAAYVYKNVGNREVGVHINYGTSYLTMERKLETAFMKSAAGSKIVRGITSAALKAKAIREDLEEAGKAVKGAMGEGKGNMYEDPNFGKMFK